MPELRCDITELPISGCAHCRGIPEPLTSGSIPAPDHTSGRPGKWIPARFPGECDGCGDPVLPGDTIRADGQGGWEGQCCAGDNDD